MHSVQIIRSQGHDWEFTSKSFQLEDGRAAHTTVWLHFSSLLDANEKFMLVAIWETSTIWSCFASKKDYCKNI